MNRKQGIVKTVRKLLVLNLVMSFIALNVERKEWVYLPKKKQGPCDCSVKLKKLNKN